MKKTYFGLGPAKLLLIAALSAAVIACGALSAQKFYEIMLSVFSIITIAYISQGKVTGCVCGIIYSAAYAAVCFSRQIYGLAVFMILLVVPLYIISLFTWKKNQNKGAVEVKRLPAAKLVLVLIASFAGYWCIFFLLGAVGSSDVLFDSLTLVFGISGMTLLSLRYVEQWYFNIASNVSVSLLWLFKSLEDASNLNFMVVAVIFVASNVVGLVSWIKMEKMEKMEKKGENT